MAADAKRLILSPSKLNLFRDCPRCFWLDVNKGIRRPRGAYPSLPTGMDGVLKRYFETYRQRGTLPPLLNGQVSGTLAKIKFDLGYDETARNARLFGKLDDCLLDAQGRHGPLDHKTRGSPPADVSYTLQYYQLQMDAYTLLLEQNRYPVSGQAVVVYYTPENGPLHQGIPFAVTIHIIPTDPRRAEQTFHAALACLNGEVPPVQPTCEYCAWAACASQ